MNRLRERCAASFQGLPAESVALIVVLGLVLGTFPIYGLPTVLCVLASLIFGLSLPAVQLVNQLATPLQLAMVLPFFKIGSRFVGAGHLPLGSLNVGAFALQAVAGWLIVCLPLGLLLHVVLTWLIRSPLARQLFQPKAALAAR